MTDSPVTANPAVMLGKPVVAGTRVTVESILLRLSAGESLEQIAQSHPRLTIGRLRAVLAWVAEGLAAERFVPAPRAAA